MCAGCADRDGLAASTSDARKRSHYYDSPGQVSFDARKFLFANVAVESFGRLRKEGGGLIDQVAASIVAGTGGSSLVRKGVCKEYFFK